MSSMNLYVRDISEVKTFSKYGDIFTQIRHNPETGWWLYKRVTKRENKPDFISYEVVRGRKHTNPDGSEVLAYPCTTDWGVLGFTISDNCNAEKMIDFYMSAKRRSPEEIHEFKKTLYDASISPGVFHIQEF